MRVACVARPSQCLDREILLLDSADLDGNTSGTGFDRHVHHRLVGSPPARAVEEFRF